MGCLRCPTRNGPTLYYLFPANPASGPGNLWLCGEPWALKLIMGGSDEQKFDQPTQKPVELMRRPILNHTKRGELVYQPFLGIGTTLAAAELTERVCVGIELGPKHLDVRGSKSPHLWTRWGRQNSCERLRPFKVCRNHSLAPLSGQSARSKSLTIMQSSLASIRLLFH
jgi:DNA methylase